MMGQQSEQKELFSYSVDLDKRVRLDHPLRAIFERIDFSFVRNEVKACHRRNEIRLNSAMTSISQVNAKQAIFSFFSFLRFSLIYSSTFTKYL